MTSYRTAPAPPSAAARTGYLIAALVNAAMLYAALVRPGWQALPFLTPDTELVLGPVTLTLVVGIAADVVSFLVGSPVLRKAGDLVTTGVGLVAVVRVLSVFPFDFTGYRFDWSLVVRVLLVLGVVGSVIGLVVAAVSLVRLLAGGPG